MYGPDTLVYNGPELPGDTLEIPNPVIVVEVLSPSTRKFDETVKKDDYFSLPSVHHYLIVDPEGPPIVHHRRQPDGTILRILDMEPCEADPCEIYDPGVSYRSALEVNQGAFAQWGVAEGDRLTLEQ